MKKTANMATMPERLSVAVQAIDSIYDQVSVIRLYLNNFDRVPQEFIDDKIVTVQGKDLKSSGKVFWARNPDEYYFCIDDDICYPPDYVEYSLDKLKQYDDDVIISFHGRKFHEKKKMVNYFRDVAAFYHCTQSVEEDKEADVIGNGVSCWNTNNITINVDEFKYHDMDDILVSEQALNQGKKRIVVSHKKGYIQLLEYSGQTLYEKYKNKHKKQTETCNSIDWWK